MKILGIDYGTKKIGIAISDEAGRLAFPHKVILNTSDLTEKILGMCAKENISAVIIGESRDFGGKPNPLMKKIIPFKKKLEYALGLPIFFEPEFLTSKQARNVQEGSALTDASAAAIILQSYLDKIKK